jgi:hypothetical protein
MLANRNDLHLKLVIAILIVEITAAVVHLGAALLVLVAAVH